MFGRNKKDTTPQQPIDIIEDKGEDKSSPLYWRNHVTDLAKVEAERLLSTSQDYFDKCLREYEQQREGFLFSCRRHGDFLTVEITRNGNPECDSRNRFFAQTFNLNKVSRIIMSEGNPADRLGRIEFLISAKPNDAYYNRNISDIYHQDSVWEMISKGCDYVSRYNVEYINTSRPIIINLEKDPNVYYSNGTGLTYYIAENYPRPSKDDIIELFPLGIKIPVPYGMGQQILEQILAELERGSNRDPIVIKT